MLFVLSRPKLDIQGDMKFVFVYNIFLLEPYGSKKITMQSC